MWGLPQCMETSVFLLRSSWWCEEAQSYIKNFADLALCKQGVLLHQQKR